jgi:hypothetical protein
LLVLRPFEAHQFRGAIGHWPGTRGDRALLRPFTFITSGSSGTPGGTIVSGSRVRNCSKIVSVCGPVSRHIGPTHRSTLTLSPSVRLASAR